MNVPFDRLADHLVRNEKLAHGTELPVLGATRRFREQ